MYTTNHVDKLEVTFENEEIAELVCVFSDGDISTLEDQKVLLEKYPRLIEGIKMLHKGRKLMEGYTREKKEVIFKYKYSRGAKTKELEEFINDIFYIEKVNYLVESYLGSERYITIDQAKSRNQSEEEAKKKGRERAILRAKNPNQKESKDGSCIIL